MNGYCCGATGLSSHAIAGAFGRCFHGGRDHPWDPSDLVRCRNFCRANGITTAMLAERMPAVSPQWAALMPFWDELLAMLATEEPSGEAPRTYERMRLILSGKPKRIQRKRVKGWHMPDGAMYVGRGTKWGNPITQEIVRLTWDSRHGTPTAAVLRSEAARCFRSEITSLIEDGEIAYPSFDAIRLELAGKDLVCWCPLASPCHADVLLEIANSGGTT